MLKQFDSKLKLSNKDAKKLIRHILDCGAVIFSQHAKDRMRERNFTDQDVVYILETGTIIDTDYDANQECWKYKVSGDDLDGDEGTIMTAVLTAHRQLIITVF